MDFISIYAALFFRVKVCIILFEECTYFKHCLIILNKTNMFVYIFIALQMFVLLVHLSLADKKNSAATAYTFKA